MLGVLSISHLPEDAPNSDPGGCKSCRSPNIETSIIKLTEIMLRKILNLFTSKRPQKSKGKVKFSTEKKDMGLSEPENLENDVSYM